MEIPRRSIWSLAALVLAVLLVFGYWLFFRGYRVEERALSQYAVQAMTERYSLEKPEVRSVERIDGGRSAAFIFRLADAAGREYHLAAAFRQSLLTGRYQPQDMFLVEDYYVGDHSGILTAQDYLRSYRFDVRGNSLQLQAAPSRLSGRVLSVSLLAMLIGAAFLWVLRLGDQAGPLEAAAAEYAAESAAGLAPMPEADDADRWLP